MDQGELAFEQEQACVVSALNHTKATKGKLQPVGVCHGCGEDVGPDQLFCDNRCAKDYDKRQTHRRLMS